MKRNRILGLLVVSACGAFLLCLLLIGGQGSADAPIHPTVASLDIHTAGVSGGSSAARPAVDSRSALEHPEGPPATALTPRVVPFDEDAERDLAELVQRLANLAALTRGAAADVAANAPTERLLETKGG